MPHKRNRITIDRWRAVQRRELDFWNRWTTLPPFQNLDLPKYWREEIGHFGETWECFRGMRVLDIGCGPVGLIHFADRAAERIRVDSLLPHYREKLTLVGRQLSLSAMAESLPLAAQSIDFAICYNALDHMWDPEAALDEIARVLRPRGAALLMVHTFPAWLRPVFWADRMHPHHYTAPSFLLMVKSRFRIERYKTVDRHFDFPAGKWWAPSSWKYLVGRFIVSTTYIRATRVD